ncbi:hypothetical protein JK163_11105 [Levilactobacillus brevis]|uniref:hypothetical protein n=1 Tax=Levilactobacillus brevis TaxID=1580 RepID=UPI001BA93AFC|nr:hypothetical protein [Levilactobacillus brevis]MBS1006816.1 hypothetical protein [Levilactobacillus brevis]MBS1014124.1 hypothetical protein [Levilactobacillus brevis]
MGLYVQGGKKVGGMYMADGSGTYKKIGGMYYADGEGNTKKIYSSFLPAGTVLYDGSSKVDWNKLLFTDPQQYQLNRPLEKLRNGIKVTYGDAYYSGVPGYNGSFTQDFIEIDHIIEKSYPISQLNSNFIVLTSTDIFGRIGNTANQNDDGKILFDLSSNIFTYKSPNNLWSAWTNINNSQIYEYAPILKIKAY